MHARQRPDWQQGSWEAWRYAETTTASGDQAPMIELKSPEANIHPATTQLTAVMLEIVFESRVVDVAWRRDNFMRLLASGLHWTCRFSRQ